MTEALLAQRGHLIGWVPLCLACGIGWYFAIKFEPPLIAFAGIGIAAFVMLGLSRIVPISLAPVCIAIVLVLSGTLVAKVRNEAVAAPVLGFRYYGPIEGRVVGIDRSGSDAVRLTLDAVVLVRMDPDRTPKHVRVSLHGDQPLAQIQPGDVLIMTGHLSPPSGPAEPGGFDFQRHAWFAQLGAVGYTRNPVLRIAVPAVPDWKMRIFAARMTLSRAVQEALPGETGAFAAAIMTGDRSAMGQDTLEALRASNLAHLLAISGLHMGLLTAFVFAAVRYGLVLIPGVGLRLPVKRIAAVFALVAGAFYLALSGGNVATERAYIMVAVMFVAVLLGRRAVTLRAVAMAAIIVLVLQPEALAGPGFQMSFAATTALVAVFGGLRQVDKRRLPKWAQPVMSVVISSFIAGLATAPFAAAHFNQFAHYGLIANLLSVPLMGVLIMPAAVVAICLAPFGLWSLGLVPMGLGLDWILLVAKTTSAQDGALGHVVAPAPFVLPLLSLGLLWLILWQGRARFAGLAGVVAAGMIWVQTTRPALLVADSGALIGWVSDAGRVLSKPRGDGFVAGVWLENDGNPVSQEEAASRTGLIRAGRIVTAALDDWTVIQVSGKTALAEIDACGGADILISNQEVPPGRPCEVFDIKRLRETGALAMSVDPKGDLHITTARDRNGLRPWNANNAPDGAWTPLVLTRDAGGANRPDQTATSLVDQ